MATQTFLNEQDSAAMLGISSLSAMLASPTGTDVQAFHTNRKLSLVVGREGVETEAQRNVLYFQILAPQLLLKLPVRFHPSWLELSCAQANVETWLRLARQSHTSAIKAREEGREGG